MAGDAPDPTPTHNFHHGPESTPMNIGSALESLLRGESMSLTWRVSVRNTFVYNTKIASRIVGKKSNVIVGESFHKVTHTGRCIVLFAIAKLRQLYSNVSFSGGQYKIPSLVSVFVTFFRSLSFVCLTPWQIKLLAPHINSTPIIHY